jgi:DNA polymerase phi
MSNDATSRKRRRESYNVDVRQVEIYEDLASEKDDVRLKAAHELVSRFTPESKPSADQINKSLQRLFRGLCSGRKAARIGFSIALTEVLSQIFAANQPATESSEVKVSDVIKVFLSVTSVTGNSSQVCGLSMLF